MIYDLNERTFKFSINSIKVLKTLNVDLFNKSLIQQVLRSSTSVGANYREANNASSKKDFKNKINICRKEIFETKYWFELLIELNPTLNTKLEEMWKEAHELSLIFSKIHKSSK